MGMIRGFFGAVGRSAAGFARLACRRARGEPRSCSGQMTVELAVAFPVMIAVAVVAVNACTFFADCAVFDRVAHQAVRVHAASPGYRQTASESCALIEGDVRSALNAPNVEVSVACSSAGFDLQRFTATMTYAPTLFGLGLRSEVFGVQMPRLSHSTSLAVDVYKPGVIV